MLRSFVQKSLQDGERENSYVGGRFKTFRGQFTETFEHACLGFVVHGWLACSGAGLWACWCYTVERPTIATFSVSVVANIFFLCK